MIFRYVSDYAEWVKTVTDDIIAVCSDNGTIIVTLKRNK